MRSIIILVASLLVLTALAVSWEIYITQNLLCMEALVEDASTIEELDSALSQWEEISRIAELVVHHNELEEVSHALVQMRVELDADPDEFLESKALLSYLLRCMRERYVVDIENVF